MDKPVQPASEELLTEVRALRADVARMLLALEAIAQQGQRAARLLECSADGGEPLCVAGPMAGCDVSPSEAAQKHAELAARSTFAAHLSADRIAESLERVKARPPSPQEVSRQTDRPDRGAPTALRPGR